MTSRKRLNSTAEVKAAEATGNLNVEWMAEKHWWPTYIAMIVSFRLLIFYFAPYLDQKGQWTLANASHAAVSGRRSFGGTRQPSAEPAASRTPAARRSP